MLKGFKGKDLLVGDSNGEAVRDALDGGPGRDALKARDGFDNFVNGGSGRDRARMNNNDVVRRVEVFF